MEEKREVRTNLFAGPLGPMFIVPGFQNNSSLTIKLTFGWKAATHCTGHLGVPLTYDPCLYSVPRHPLKLGLILECSTAKNSHLEILESFQNHPLPGTSVLTHPAPQIPSTK